VETLEVQERYFHSRALITARLNEEWFRDAAGFAHKNNWHHTDWFELAERHDRLLIEAAREHSKTQVFGTTLPLVRMAENQNIRILIISDVYDKAQQRTKVLKKHILQNEVMQDHTGGALRIDRVRGDEEFTLERDFYWLKEPTVTSTYAGAPISGGRYDIIIADDLVSYLVNANTPGKRLKMTRWWFDEVENSIAPGGVIWVIGTHQHHEDLYEKLKRQPEYHVEVYPAVDEEDTGYGHLDYASRNSEAGVEGDDKIVLWPKRFTYAQHMAKKNNPSTHDSYLRQQQQLAVPETGLVYRKPLMDQAFARGTSVAYDEEATQFLGLDPGYGKRASLLAIQERAGDRIDLWMEHSFTQMTDEDISKVVCDHCAQYGVEAIFIDAEDPGLAAKIRKDRDARGLTFKVVQVAFGKYKRLAIKATRWLLQSQRLSWKGESTTVHTPGRTFQEPSLFRREMTAYALKKDEDDKPEDEDDHGPDAWVAFASKWVGPWIRATEGQEAA
jgi:hypothetical protein